MNNLKNEYFHLLLVFAFSLEVCEEVIVLFENNAAMASV